MRWREGFGSTEIEALGEVHAAILQRRQRRGVFNALGDCLLVERVGDLDDRLDDCLVGLVDYKVAHEVYVDLQVARVEALEIDKGPEARAEVVKRELATDVAEPLPKRLGLLEIGHSSCLGDLDEHVVGVQSVGDRL